MNKDIYLDYNATTPVASEVLQAMLPYFSEQFGNSAATSHSYGWQAEAALEKCRQRVAELLGANSNHEIFFTSGATESNNWVLNGLVEQIYRESLSTTVFETDNCDNNNNNNNNNCNSSNRDQRATNTRPHIITSSIEHASVLKSCQRLQELGWADVTYLQPDAEGLITVSNLESSIRPQTRLISLIWVQNEIGAINPIAELSAVAKARQIYFHTDATQAIGKVAIHLKNLDIDMLSFSAHKFYGPKGVGILYKRAKNPHVQIAPLIVGGGHERGERSGTVNLPLIAGMTAALELVSSKLSTHVEQLQGLQGEFWTLLRTAFPRARLNGPAIGAKRACNNLNVTFVGCHIPMSLQGIAVSRGSACHSGKWTPSPVLRALGLSEAEAQSTLRISMGLPTTIADIHQAVTVLKKQITSN